MRRALWVVLGLCAGGCGFSLSLDPTDRADAGAAGTSSGGTFSSSGGSGSSGTTPSSSSGSQSTSSGNSSGATPDPPDGDADTGVCQPVLGLQGAFCGGSSAVCTRADNTANAVSLPAGTMSVNVANCNSGSINGGHVQTTPHLPAAFRVVTHFQIKKDQAPLVVLLLGADAPSSIEQSACSSLQTGDVVVAFYYANENGALQWKLQSQTTCSLPNDPEAIGKAPNDTQVSLELTYDGTSLRSGGTVQVGAESTALAPSTIPTVTLRAEARLAFAAYALDDKPATRNSVLVDELRVLCP